MVRGSRPKSGSQAKGKCYQVVFHKFRPTQKNISVQPRSQAPANRLQSQKGTRAAVLQRNLMVEGVPREFRVAVQVQLFHHACPIGADRLHAEVE